MNSFAITDEGKKAIFDAFVAAGKNGKVAITGFSANTRNLEFHEKLALNRAKAVREALVAAGMYEGFIEIRPSEFITGAVDARAAHRVDIVKAN
jgi:cytochrome c oxidase subunit 2